MMHSGFQCHQIHPIEMVGHHGRMVKMAAVVSSELSHKHHSDHCHSYAIRQAAYCCVLMCIFLAELLVVQHVWHAKPHTPLTGSKNSAVGNTPIFWKTCAQHYVDVNFSQVSVYHLVI